MTSTFSSALSGFGFGLSLIVAIGAQNAYVLRQGITRTHVAAVVGVCAVSDVLLIAAGVGGFGAVLRSAPEVLVVARWAGAAFLFGYAALALRRAWSPAALLPADPEPGDYVASGAVLVRAAAAATGGDAPAGAASGGGPGPLGSVASGPSRTVPALGATIATTLALTWLNPHVYLDTVVLLGSFASAHAGADRWYLAAGAMTASVLWFVALGYGARLLGPLFARPGAWRGLDAAIALIMVALGAGLLLG
ncbi:LysE/ArgO family amino acid transporter [Nocardia asteroides]|uniref:LysE/ArgO family amino acid transporter n=1 Tax=Nocardia asteroides TaxID=1824 RepID=UPI001E472A2A|nr:LysE/ArgO family amino acid transporter [Nocardia asteroides]UGT60554.1 LysE/ArgO family amino acid transporter [Nocardia asteroides]